MNRNERIAERRTEIRRSFPGCYKRRYEISNHMGNVLAVVGDRKIVVTSSSKNGTRAAGQGVIDSPQGIDPLQVHGAVGGGVQHRSRRMESIIAMNAIPTNNHSR